MGNGTDIVGVLVGGAVALIGKIVWDWFKERTNPASHESCKRLEELEKAFHSAHLTLAQDVAVIKADLSYIKKKLDLNGKS